MVGPTFYNYVLVPTGMVLLATTAAVPLLRWGKGPHVGQQRWLLRAAAIGAMAAAAAWLAGIHHSLELAVTALAVAALAAILGALVLEAQRAPGRPWTALARALARRRRQYTGFLIHLGFACLAIGITGSSLRTHQHELEMQTGETVDFAGYQVRLDRLTQQALPDKLIGAAELEISRAGQRLGWLLPAQHFHLLPQTWTTEVAIYSTWRSDLYVILHSGEGTQKASLTLIENPMMRWFWVGGGIMGLGSLVQLVPSRRRVGKRADLPLDRARFDPSAHHIVRKAAAAVLLAAIPLLPPSC
jgi:cytochrome c-type biogenesis protein CcmF